MNRYKNLLPPVLAVLLALACGETSGPLLPEGTDRGLEPQGRMVLDNVLRWPSAVTADQFSADLTRDGVTTALAPRGHIVNGDNVYETTDGPYTISFWAVKGVAMEAEIDFEGMVNGQWMSGEFLDFELRSNSLYKRPNGSLIANGDSVLITIVVDPVNMGVTLYPAGLEFHSNYKPELELWYGILQGDINGDGVVDGEDEDIEEDLVISVRQGVGNPWLELPTVVDEPREEVRAWLPHFSEYAVSW